MSGPGETNSPVAVTITIRPKAGVPFKAITLCPDAWNTRYPGKTIHDLKTEQGTLIEKGQPLLFYEGLGSTLHHELHHFVNDRKYNVNCSSMRIKLSILTLSYCQPVDDRVLQPQDLPSAWRLRFPYGLTAYGPAACMLLARAAYGTEKALDNADSLSLFAVAVWYDEWDFSTGCANGCTIDLKDDPGTHTS